MNRIFLYIFLIIFYCNNSFAERVTLGFSGDSCKMFNQSKEEFGKVFDDMFQSEMIGFLTGHNMYVAELDGDSDRMKILKPVNLNLYFFSFHLSFSSLVSLP